MFLDELINILVSSIEIIGEWILGNLPGLVYSLIAIAIGYTIQSFLVSRIAQLDEKNRINEHLANTLTKIVK